MPNAGVFCFEGDWSPDLRTRSSVRPLLELIEQERQVDTIYRHIGTVAELEHYVKVWRQKRYGHYRLGWFAFHGEPGALFIGRKTITLEQLAHAIGRNACAGKVIFFGACSVMAEDSGSIAEFRRFTGAHTVCGFTEDVDWFEAAAFELLLLDAFSYGTQTAAVFKRSARDHKPFMRTLGFRTDPIWRPTTRRHR